MSVLGVIASLLPLTGISLQSPATHFPLPLEKSIPASERLNNKQAQSGGGELTTFEQLMNYIKVQPSPYFSSVNVEYQGVLFACIAQPASQADLENSPFVNISCTGLNGKILRFNRNGSKQELFIITPLNPTCYGQIIAREYGEEYCLQPSNSRVLPANNLLNWNQRSFLLNWNQRSLVNSSNFRQKS